MRPTAIGALKYSWRAARTRACGAERWRSTSTRVSRRNAPPVWNVTFSVFVMSSPVIERVIADPLGSAAHCFPAALVRGDSPTHLVEARRGLEASSSPASARSRTLADVALLAVPQPYDFDVSLDRFKFW